MRELRFLLLSLLSVYSLAKHTNGTEIQFGGIVTNLEEKISELRHKHSKLQQKYNICKDNYIRLNNGEDTNNTLSFLNSENSDPYAYSSFEAITGQLQLLKNLHITQATQTNDVTLNDLQQKFLSNVSQDLQAFQKLHPELQDTLSFLKETAQSQQSQMQKELEILKNSQRDFNEKITDLLKIHQRLENQLIQLKQAQSESKAALPNNLKDNTQNFEILSSKSTVNQNSDFGLDLETSERTPKSCVEAIVKTGNASGIYEIEAPNESGSTLSVVCDADYDGGGWLVFQRRKDGSVSFNRNWADYKNGFGDLNGEFWFGLDKLHHITTSKPHELYIAVEEVDGRKSFNKFDHFVIGNENEAYQLKSLGQHTGDSEFLTSKLQMKFSTPDRDNDNWSGGNCGQTQQNGWWCGVYNTGLNLPYGQLVWGRDNEITFVQMMIRPKENFGYALRDDQPIKLSDILKSKIGF